MVTAIKPLLGNETDAYGADPTSEVYRFRYKLVDLADLVTSHKPDLTLNPQYPKELQPRIRDRAASRNQIEGMARHLNPAVLLHDSGFIDTGPMIVGPDNVVESGNGRTLALMVATQEAPENYERYRKMLATLADKYGFTRDQVEGMPHPVLVREREGEVDRVQFAAAANVGAVMGMSPYEQALQDSKRLSAEVVGQLEVGEDQTVDQALRARGNDFIVQHFVSQVPANERATIADDRGQINSQGLARLRLALFAKTYTGEAGQKLTRIFGESADPYVKQLETAMFGTLPDMAKAMGLIEAGSRDRDLDVAPDLAEVVDTYASLKVQGISVSDYLQQSQMFEERLTPFQKQILEHLDDIARKTKTLREFFREVAQKVIASPPPGQGSLLGDARVSKEEMVNGIINRQRAEAGKPALPVAPALSRGPQLAPADTRGASGPTGMGGKVGGGEPVPASSLPEPGLSRGASVQVGLAGFGPQQAQVKMLEEWGTAPGSAGQKQQLIDEAELLARIEAKPLKGQMGFEGEVVGGAAAREPEPEKTKPQAEKPKWEGKGMICRLCQEDIRTVHPMQTLKAQMVGHLRHAHKLPEAKARSQFYAWEKQGKDLSPAPSVVTPNVGDTVTWNPPATGEHVPMNYRGVSGPGTVMLYNPATGSQVAVPQSQISQALPDMDVMVREAARWQGAAMIAARLYTGDRKASLALSRMTTKGDLDAYLMRRFNVDASTARDVSNELTAKNIRPDPEAVLTDFQAERWAKAAIEYSTVLAPDKPEPRQQAYAQAADYIRSLRSQDKQAYASKYWNWVADGSPGQEPPRGKISMMAAQAVRLGLARAIEGLQKTAVPQHPEPEPAKLEPWQMTRAAFIEAGPDGYSEKGNYGWSKTGGDHGAAVADALANGRPVTAEVLRDYPELAQPKAPVKARPFAGTAHALGLRNKLTAAEAKLASLQKQQERHGGSYIPEGEIGGVRSMSQKRKDQRMDKTIELATKIVDTQNYVANLKGRIEAYEEGHITENGRHVRTQAEEEAQSKYEGAMMEKIQPGDSIEVWTGNLVKVTKVNKRSVVSDGGVKWAPNEIVRVVKAEPAPTPPESGTLPLAAEAKKVLVIGGGQRSLVIAKLHKHWVEGPGGLHPPVVDVSPENTPEQIEANFEKALGFEAQRSPRGRFLDESQDHDRMIPRKELTHERLQSWKRHPGRADIRGVDSGHGASIQPRNKNWNKRAKPRLSR